MLLAYCANSTMFLASLRVYSQNISTARKKIAQVYLQYLHVFPSLPFHYAYKLNALEEERVEKYFHFTLCTDCDYLVHGNIFLK